MSGGGGSSEQGTELELKSSLLKLYQAYDVATDEYDKLYDIVDNMREEYDNSKHFFVYKRYKEFKRIIKNAVRKWRTVEKRITLQLSKKLSSAGLENIINGGACGVGAAAGGGSNDSMYGGGGGGGVGGGGMGGGRDGVEKLLPLTNNLTMRIRSYSSATTRDLYTEAQRLEKEILHYKTKNVQMKSTLLKLAADYETSKTHVIHLYGRYKQLRLMIKDVVQSDI